MKTVIIKSTKNESYLNNNWEYFSLGNAHITFDEIKLQDIQEKHKISKDEISFALKDPFAISCIDVYHDNEVRTLIICKTGNYFFIIICFREVRTSDEQGTRTQMQARVVTARLLNRRDAADQNFIKVYKKMMEKQILEMNS